MGWRTAFSQIQMTDGKNARLVPDSGKGKERRHIRRCPGLSITGPNRPAPAHVSRFYAGCPAICRITNGQREVAQKSNFVQDMGTVKL